MTNRFLLVVVSSFLFCVGASDLRAASDHRLAILGAADYWLHPQDGYHGVFLAAYDIENINRGAHFGAEINTDTFRLAFDRIPLWENRLETGVRTGLELSFAGLLPDYYRKGKKIDSLGFKASYAFGESYLKANLPNNQYLELALGARYWFFATAASTDANFVLPQDMLVIEPELRYTYWRIDFDPSLKDRHRLYPRVRGIAFGISAGVDFRSSNRAWGMSANQVAGLLDPRNHPDSVILSFRQWLRAGWQVNKRIRTQIEQRLAYGVGEDDLSRDRIGGLNPYVVSLAGAPWAAFLSEKYVSLQSSWHFRVYDQIEFGFLFQAILLEDVERSGREDVYSLLAGIGSFVDFRLGEIQVDFRAGWTPSLSWESDVGAFSVFASLGWQWN